MGVFVPAAVLAQGEVDIVGGVLFTVINPSFSVLHAAKLLGAVRWADDDQTYVPTVKDVTRGGQGSGPRWRMTARGGSRCGGCVAGGSRRSYFAC